MKASSGMKRKAVRTPLRLTLPVVEGEEPMFYAAAAEHLGYTLRTLYTMCSEGQIKPDLIHRGRPVFFKSSLNRWMRSQTVVPTA